MTSLSPQPLIQWILPSSAVTLLIPVLEKVIHVQEIMLLELDAAELMEHAALLVSFAMPTKLA